MAYSNDHYIKILYKDFNILGCDITTLIKVYRYDIYKIGIVAHSKKINFSYSFSLENGAHQEKIDKEIIKMFEKTMKEKGYPLKNNSNVIAFEMPAGEIFLSF